MPGKSSNSKRIIIFLGAMALCGVLGLVAAPRLLTALGRSLVLPDHDAGTTTLRADVLGIPDSRWLPSISGADRLTVASDWVCEGRAKVVVMTCGTVYGISGCDMAQNTLAAQGRPRLPLRDISLPSSPSEVEAAALLAGISQLGAASAVILVDPLESRRLNRIYQREAKRRGMRVDLVVAPDPRTAPGDSWRQREGRKALVFELSQWVGFP